jgi:hypothetical protein
MDPRDILVEFDVCDLCFLIDCTGSMGSHIKMAEERTAEVIQEIIKDFPTHKINIGIVGYRDIKETNRFDIFEFSNDADAAIKFLNGLSAEGGSDIPEDVNGGFQKVINQLKWTGDTKIIFHIADAPCHGKEFHNESDDYPDGAPEDVSWQELFNKMKAKHMNYIFFKIEKCTDKMFKKFKEIYEKVPIESHAVFLQEELGQMGEEGEGGCCSCFSKQRSGKDEYHRKYVEHTARHTKNAITTTKNKRA